RVLPSACSSQFKLVPRAQERSPPRGPSQAHRTGHSPMSGCAARRELRQRAKGREGQGRWSRAISTWMHPRLRSYPSRRVGPLEKLLLCRLALLHVVDLLGSLVLQLNRLVRGLVTQIGRLILHLVEGGFLGGF